MRNILSKLILASAVLLASPNADAIERQRAMNWCWAAAIQDILTPVGIWTSQVEIAQRLTGRPIDRPASTNEVQLLVQSYGIRSQVISRPGNAHELINTLSSGYKIIALAYPSGGAVGHFIVLEGTDGRGVWVADPATGKTQYTPIADLYIRWHWTQSIVVG